MIAIRQWYKGNPSFIGLKLLIKYQEYRVICWKIKTDPINNSIRLFSSFLLKIIWGHV